MSSSLAVRHEEIPVEREPGTETRLSGSASLGDAVPFGGGLCQVGERHTRLSHVGVNSQCGSYGYAQEQIAARWVFFMKINQKTISTNQKLFIGAAALNDQRKGRENYREGNDDNDENEILVGGKSTIETESLDAVITIKYVCIGINFPFVVDSWRRDCCDDLSSSSFVYYDVVGGDDEMTIGTLRVKHEEIEGPSISRAQIVPINDR